VILAAILELLLITILANASFPQDNKPLGDVARDARAAKSSAPKSAHVITNEDVPDRKGGEQVGQLSPKKQAFCDFMRRRKDTAAEQSCALMSVDMGPEYEETTARYVELASGFCGVGGGMPSSPPQDPVLAARYREANAALGKFMDLWKAEREKASDAEAPILKLREEENRELERDVPDLRNPEAVKANPQELQRFADIEKKYDRQILASTQTQQQQNVRMQRFLADQVRMEHVCDSH
jgi:hypothetical protein